MATVGRRPPGKISFIMNRANRALVMVILMPRSSNSWSVGTTMVCNIIVPPAGSASQAILKKSS